jgi:hypothetical protein
MDLKCEESAVFVDRGVSNMSFAKPLAKSAKPFRIPFLMPYLCLKPETCTTCELVRMAGPNRKTVAQDMSADLCEFLEVSGVLLDSKRQAAPSPVASASPGSDSPTKPGKSVLHLLK